MRIATALFGTLLLACLAPALTQDYSQRSGSDQQEEEEPKKRKGPVGGPAPANAVELAKLRFLKLYNEAAARSAAAPDEPEVPEQPQPQPRRPAILAGPPAGYYPGPAPQQAYYPPPLPPQQFQPQPQPQPQPRPQPQPQPQFQPQAYYPPPPPQQYQPAGGYPPQYAPRPAYPTTTTPKPTYPPAETDPLAGPPDPVTDTPEVAAAKSAFLQQFQFLALQSAASPDPYTLQQQQYAAQQYQQPGYYGK